MIDLTCSYPIPSHPTWDIHDSSKMQAFKTCPRKYFYRYILGWEVDYPQLNLIFGEGWHRAMEVLFTRGYSKHSIELGYQVFLDYYSRFFAERDWLHNAPKDPTSALEGLIKYVETYQGIDNFEVLTVEKSGSVLISDDIQMHYRLDAVVRDKVLGIVDFDHKTTKWTSLLWVDQFQLDFQMNLYTHALYSMYPANEVYGVKINGMIFLKSKIEPQRVPLQKSYPHLNAWLFETRNWLMQIKREFSFLEQAHESDEFLIAFPKNDKGCIAYMHLCPYHHLCTSWCNPLQRCDKLQLGFKQMWWDPSDKEKGEE